MENIDIDNIIKEAEEEVRAFDRNSKIVSIKIINALKQIKNHGVLHHVSNRLTLFGVFSPDKQLKAVHWSEDGAKQNQENYGKGYYVDEFLIGS